MSDKNSFLYCAILCILNNRGPRMGPCGAPFSQARFEYADELYYLIFYFNGIVLCYIYRNFVGWVGRKKGQVKN